MPDRSLDEIGLGRAPRLIIYLLALLPFVGLVIGSNYALRKNAATRQFGRRLFTFALGLHAFYMLCVCPTAFLWALAGRM